MKHEKPLLVMTGLILAGMIGIYIAAWKAYSYYKANQATISTITSSPFAKLFGA